METTTINEVEFMEFVDSYCSLKNEIEEVKRLRNKIRSIVNDEERELTYIEDPEEICEATGLVNDMRSELKRVEDYMMGGIKTLEVLETVISGFSSERKAMFDELVKLN